MKKTLLLMIMAAFFSLPSSAQLRVFQNGNVCVKGTNTTSNIGLSIGNINYDSNYNVYTSSMNPATGSFNIALEGRTQPSTAQSTGHKGKVVNKSTGSITIQNDFEVKSGAELEIMQP